MTQPWWDKTVYAPRRTHLAVRSQVMSAIRSFFQERNFIEVDTAMLQLSPGLDRHVRPVPIELRSPFELATLARYLHTSPEFAMKKLLSAGEKRIFQICRVWRDAEDSAVHQPEFTLLEWYRTEADYSALMKDVEELIDFVCSMTNQPRLQAGDHAMQSGDAWVRMTVADAFLEFADIDLLATIDDGFDPSSSALFDAVQKAGMTCNPTDSWDDLFHRILLERVEPNLATRGGVFLTDYPIVVGALARRKKDDPRLAERVEAYVCGMELANGFSELTDPVEQRRRFERDSALYSSLYGTPAPIDEGFLSALQAMPPAAGMALGVDRLVMLLTGASHIRDVQWTPMDLLSTE